MQRDYSQTWNAQQSPNYKPNSKPTMPPTGTYQPLTTSYSLLPQQQYYVASYPYQTHAVGNNENEHFSSIETFALFFSIIIQ